MGHTLGLAGDCSGLVLCPPIACRTVLHEIYDHEIIYFVLQSAYKPLPGLALTPRERGCVNGSSD